jgi:hypothetical protein
LRDSVDQDAPVSRNIGLVGQKVLDGFFLLLSIGRYAVMGEGIAFEEIRHQHNGVESSCQKIGTLKSLVRHSKYIIDIHEPDASVHIAGDV